jgi:signal transduction histidine kinase
MVSTRVMTDFMSLLTAVDRLMVDIGHAMEAPRDLVRANGDARPLMLNRTISMLQHHAESFAESLRHVGDSPCIHEVVIELSRAHSQQSMADTLGSYCAKAFRSPAGMIFLERDGGLQLVSRWSSSSIARTRIVEEIARKGPVAYAFRTGEPVFWRVPRDSGVGRYFYRLLQRTRARSLAFLPVGLPRQRPIGVLAMALSNNGFAPAASDDLMRLGQIVGGCFMHGRAYDEAFAARRRAEDAIATKDEFFSVLSHELKNPMTSVLGWAVALSSGTLPAEKQNLALDSIVRNVRALNYLVEDLFDAARISSGKFRLELAETRIQDVAREALNTIQHNLESKKLRISTDISESVPTFMADSRRLQQAIMNLLNNAVKFTPCGGSVALRVRRRNHHVECMVSDTGKGIDRKFLPFVFERFRQERRPSKVHKAGLGLGLAIVREIVELHGGSIEAFSEGMDRGATFIVRLPLRRGHRPAH